MLIYTCPVAPSYIAGGNMEYIELLRGKPVADSVEANLKAYIDSLASEFPVPSLVIVKVGDDPSSEAYVKSKVKACSRVGIKSSVLSLGSSTTQDYLLHIIDLLNNDDSVSGILVQLPLPKHMDERVIANSIDPIKDVDCFTDVNLGKFYSGDYLLAPCTPLGVMKLLDFYNIDVTNKLVAILGRSNIAGKPMAEMILSANGTPVIIHSKTPIETRDEILKQADIVISATGFPKLLTEDSLINDSINPVCIDIGITRVDSKLQGDFDIDSFKHPVQITPVPGGTGLTTVASLLENTVNCYIMNMKARR